MLEQMDFIRSTRFVCTTNYSMKPPTEIKETRLTPTPGLMQDPIIMMFEGYAKNSGQKDVFRLSANWFVEASRLNEPGLDYERTIVWHFSHHPSTIKQCRQTLHISGKYIYI